MKTLAELVAELGAVDAKIDALLAKNTADEQDEAQLAELDATATALKAQMDSAKTREDIAARSAARSAALQEPATPASSPVKKAESVAVSSGLRERVQDDPRGGFARYDDFLGAVQNASAAGGVVDENLLTLNAAYGNNSEAGSEGGFLVPPEYSNRILERVEGMLPILNQCDRLTLSGNTVTVNGSIDHDKSSTTYRNGGVIPYWVGESDSITKSSLKFRQITLRLHKLAALSFVTEEEISDVANFGTRLLKKQSEAISQELIEAVMFGSGVAKPLGAFTGSSPCVEVAKETGQTADSIVAENIFAMEEVLYPESIGKASWYYNPFCHKQLRTLALSVGTGGSIVNLFDGKSNTLDGINAYRTDHCEALGDAGDIVLADWSQYLLATKGTIDTAMSIHLRFDYAETAFRSLFRVDGRPAWDTNLKPRKGASTARISPFVKLAARA